MRMVLLKMEMAVRATHEVRVIGLVCATAVGMAMAMPLVLALAVALVLPMAVELWPWAEVS